MYLERSSSPSHICSLSFCLRVLWNVEGGAEHRRCSRDLQEVRVRNVLLLFLLLLVTVKRLSCFH